MKLLIIILAISVLTLFVIEPVFAPKPTDTPDKVENLSVTAVSKSQINLSWDEPNDNDSPITGYQIEQRSQGPWIIIVANTGSAKTTYSDVGLEQDTTYSYRVSAINAEGVGRTSSPESATTYGLPTKPRSLEATPGNSQVILSWKEPVSDGGSTIISYKIEYSENNGNAWIIFDEGTSKITEAIITELTNNRNYLFRVSAINSVGAGQYSQVSSMPINLSTGGSDERKAPEILGIGFYKIKTTNIENPYSKILLGVEIDNMGGFKEFVPYSQYSDKIDQKNYGGFENYEKRGQYILLKDNSLTPTFYGNPNESIQIQVRLEDQYASTKIEHMGFYINSENNNDHELSDIKIIWNKGQPLDIIDKKNVLSDVSVNTSLENGWLWAIIDLVFEKELPESDITIEAWNELRKPKIKTIKDSIEISKSIENDKEDIISLRVDVTVNHNTSNPVCHAHHTCFIPYNAKILQGGIVSWVNTDSFLHDVESGTPGNHDGRFDLHMLPGETAQKKFEHPGIYDYFCRLHPWATGVVTVLTKDGIEPPINYDDSKSVLHVVSETSNGSLMIQHKDNITIPNKDLSVEISGHIQEGKAKQPIIITISKPSGIIEKISTHTNGNGYYFIPTKLSDRWEKGEYKVSTLYRNSEIASIEFTINDTQGIGGNISPFSDMLERKLKAIHEHESSIEKLKTWLKELNLEAPAIDHILNRMTLFNIK